MSIGQFWDDHGMYVCVYCGHPFEEVDHVWPFALGGNNEQWNRVPACTFCNRRKSGRPALGFLSDTPEIHKVLHRLGYVL